MREPYQDDDYDDVFKPVMGINFINGLLCGIDFIGSKVLLLSHQRRLSFSIIGSFQAQFITL
jgi:hypothetical protein